MAEPFRSVPNRHKRRVDGRRLAIAATTHRVVRPPPPSVDQVDERELVDLARSDANAFAELYRRYVQRIYAYAHRRSGSQVVAEDVTSATFEKALRGLATYRWREPGIAPWLFRIASNEFANHHRRVARQERIVRSLQQAERPLNRDTSEFCDHDDSLRTALAQLRPRYQHALALRYFADLTNEEAATAMGVSRRTMAVLVHRSTAALRRQLESVQPEEVFNRG